MNKRYVPIYETALIIGMFLCLSDVRADIGSIVEVQDLQRQAREILQKEPAKAIPLFKRALHISEKEHIIHTLAMDILLGLADAYEAVGDHPKALALRTRAGPTEEAHYLRRQAREMFYQKGGDVKSLSFAQRALALTEKIHGPDHEETAYSLETLGKIYKQNSDPAKAIPLLRRALDIFEMIRGLDHRDTIRLVDELAGAYEWVGDDSKALPLRMRARTVRIVPSSRGQSASVPIKPPWLKDPTLKIWGQRETGIASSQINMAESYFSAGAFAEAEPFYQAALTIREKQLGSDHPDTLTLLRDFSLFYFALGDHDRAISLMELAQQREEQNLVRFLWNARESQKRTYVENRQAIANVNVSLSLSTPNPRAKALGLTEVLQYKGRMLNTSSRQSELRHRDPRTGMFPKDDRADVAQVLSAMLFHGPGKLSYPVYEQRLQGLVQLQENLQPKDYEIQTINLERVRKFLPTDRVLVEWFRYRQFNPKAKEGGPQWSSERYVAYVLKPAGDVTAFDLGLAEPIDLLVAEFREAISSRNNTSYQLAASDLYNKVIAPLQIDLTKDTKLLLSPDGALNLIPFAALLDGNGNYLLQCCEITYLNSGSDLVQLDNYSPFWDWPLVIANPDYGRAIEPDALDLKTPLQPELDWSRKVFVPLPGTSAEAKAVQSVLKLPDTFVLTGAAATETRLRKVDSPKILHLATHGFFFPNKSFTEQLVNTGEPNQESIALTLAKSPLMRSGLALTGANIRREGESDDGILTAAELSTLNLRRTQLVVLSACDTGLGTIQADGVYGLRRALALAGAETQVVSLWIVDDVAVQPLMESYYTRLNQGEGRSEALRSVQLGMMTKPAYQHPFFWAAFIPIGNWEPLHN